MHPGISRYVGPLVTIVTVIVTLVLAWSKLETIESHARDLGQFERLDVHNAEAAALEQRFKDITDRIDRMEEDIDGLARK